MHPHYSHLLQFGIPGTKSRAVRFVFEFADTFHRDVLWFWGCVWRGWPPQRASRSTSSSRFCPSKTEEPSNWRPSTRRDRQVPQDIPLEKLSICPHFEVICMFILFFIYLFLNYCIRFQYCPWSFCHQAITLKSWWSAGRRSSSVRYKVKHCSLFVHRKKNIQE